MTSTNPAILVKVSAKTPFEHRNRTMIAGLYTLGTGKVGFGADGTITGWPDFTKYDLHVTASDPESEGVRLVLMKGKSSREFTVTKINGNLVLRNIECLEKAIDPNCIFPMTTSIRYLFRKLAR